MISSDTIFVTETYGSESAIVNTGETADAILGGILRFRSPNEVDLFRLAQVRFLVTGEYSLYVKPVDTFRNFKAYFEDESFAPSYITWSMVADGFYLLRNLYNLTR